LSPLGKTWQPTFCVVEGDTARVLLEREPRADVEAMMPAVILAMERKGEQPISVFWFLTEKDPLLMRELIPERKSGPLQPGCGLEFGDTVTTDRGPANHFMNWGHTLRCGLLSRRSLGIEISWIGAPIVKRALYRQSESEFTLDEPFLAKKAPAAFDDFTEKSGELITESESSNEGEVTVSLNRIPTPAP